MSPGSGSTPFAPEASPIAWTQAATAGASPVPDRTVLTTLYSGVELLTAATPLVDGAFTQTYDPRRLGSNSGTPKPRVPGDQAVRACWTVRQHRDCTRAIANGVVIPLPKNARNLTVYGALANPSRATVTAVAGARVLHARANSRGRWRLRIPPTPERVRIVSPGTPAIRVRFVRQFSGPGALRDARLSKRSESC